MWIEFFTLKVSPEFMQGWEQAKARCLELLIETSKIEEALKLLAEVHNESRKYAGRVKEINKLLLLAAEKKAAIERLEAKHGNAFAKAAAVDIETRNRANNLKPIVEKTEDCPYCNGELGGNPHLDHIYPVSKGGLSIVENLIWCCATCNALKTDKGLTQFMREQGLPIEQILSRLHSLGKHV